MRTSNQRSLIVLFVLLICSCSSKEEQPIIARPEGKPNIIYIMADDLGYGDLSIQGQKQFQTPNIDRLADEGMRFSQHYAGSTVCAPSRSSLMTGLHTGHTPIRGNKEVKPEGQHPLDSSTVTVAKLLKQAGYQTGAIGKWGLGAPGSEGAPENQGFDHFFGYNCQREAHHFYPDHLWRNAEKVEITENSNGKEEIYSHDLIEKEALAFIKNNFNKPFFLYLPITIPHASMDVPDVDIKPFLNSFEEEPYLEGNHYKHQSHPKAAFAGMVTRMDQTVGKILDILGNLDIADNTIVIFTSDNGPHLEGGHDPDFFDSNGPLRGYKRDLYEGGIRVPLIARWTGTIEPNSTSNHISAFWDFMPTACEIAEIESPEFIDGISYLPAMTGQNQPQHSYLYWEFHQQGGKQAVRMGNWKAVRQNIQKDTIHLTEIYDLSNDLGETNDISGEHSDLVKQMEKIMNDAHQPSPVFKLELDSISSN